MGAGGGRASQLIASAFAGTRSGGGAWVGGSWGLGGIVAYLEVRTVIGKARRMTPESIAMTATTLPSVVIGKQSP